MQKSVKIITFSKVPKICPYVGDTKGCLKTRINEHRKSVIDGVKRKDHQKLLPTPQHIKDNPTHNIDWGNTLILHRESKREKRRVSEMLHINFINNTINRQEDTIFK